MNKLLIKIFLKLKSNSPKFKSNIFKRNWKDFDKSIFISDFANAYWEEISDVNNENVVFSLNNYLCNIDLLLEKHASLKTAQQTKIKF